MPGLSLRAGGRGMPGLSLRAGGRNAWAVTPCWR